MAGYLIYHPKRQIMEHAGKLIHHDSLEGNQDPYIWQAQFLHSYCHITQMRPQVGDINFWVAGDTFPHFQQLFCDLVFVVASKHYWPEANQIAPDEPLVDSAAAYADHYQWAQWQHQFKRRRRFTLKADPARSFQGLNHDWSLIDIVPGLAEAGLDLERLRSKLRAGFNSQPMALSAEQATALYQWLDEQAAQRWSGAELAAIRNPAPASDPSKARC
ncbi:hypothetical protein [Herpetosiphon giganteus]|uniref:hypothetical protein n=1 Tax=Herpetosiphon giganteus TaxID=2029754 RepID=UPI00195D91E4|nr:hypothetical protein [Herpetosiphon giganteus]MBM7845665.1 hypothetical protein [Herpetosiphon giganteus]